MKNDMSHSGHPGASLLDENSDQRNKAQPKQTRTMPKKEGEEKKRHGPVIHEKNEFNEILEIIFSEIHFLMAYMDRDFNFIRVNVAYAQASRQHPDFFIGKNHFELFPNEENEAIFREVVETGDRYQTFARPFEYPDEPERGVTYWNWTLHPLKGADGRVHSLVLILIDVTEREQAQKRALLSEEQYRLLSENIDEVFRMSTPGIKEMVYVSPAYERIWGRSRESLYKSPTSFIDAVHPEDRDRVLAEVERHAKGKWNIEYRIVRPDDTIRWIHDRGFPIYDDQGHVTRMYSVASDTTEIKQAQISLSESKVLLESVFESLEEVVFVINPKDRTIFMCNSAIESIFGYTVEEVIGRNTAFLHVSNAMYREFGRELLTALERGETFHTQFRMKRKDRRIFPTDHTVKEILDLSGNRIGLVSVIRDLTDQKEAEEALRMYLKELERSNKELQDFAYVASHDLQEPLRKIQTFGDRLATKYADRLEPSARDYLERMLNAAKRMRALIKALLDFSRVHTKSSPFQDVNLMKVAEEAKSNLEFRIEKTQGTVEIGDLPTIEADHHQMVQLMQNLMSNALKFHKEEGPPRVIITGELIDRYKGRKREGLPPGRLCRISIEDAGIGFDEAYLDRIFAPFQRLHGRSQYEGVGMGLAICRKIVERHRGVIKTRSEPGKGSTFTVILPVIQTRKR